MVLGMLGHSFQYKELVIVPRTFYHPERSTML